MRPGVGRRPTKLLKEQGILIDPPRSVPMASGAIAAAIEAPAPPLDPPAVTFTFQGFLVVPNILLDVLIS